MWFPFLNTVCSSISYILKNGRTSVGTIKTAKMIRERVQLLEEVEIK